MASTTITAVLEWVATQVAATTPPLNTAPVNTAFVLADSGALPEFEPNGSTIFRQHDRRFEIRAPSERELQTSGTASYRDIEQVIEVEILYVVSLARATLYSRIGRDREALQNRLLLRTGNPTGVKLVSAAGSSVRKKPHPDVVSLTLTFTVQYQLATA